MENKGREGYGVVGAIRMEKCKKEEKPVKRERERDEQMEWAGTILVHDGIISMRLQYVTADTVYIPL